MSNEEGEETLRHSDKQQTINYKPKLYLCPMETLTLNAPVSFTAGCVNELKRLRSTEAGLKPFLRVGVKGGGCSGMTYVLGWDDKTEKDELYDINGIPVIMEKSHGIYLMGMEVDFEDGLNARGFVFNNPNASKTCGCGTSFSV